MSAVAFFRPDRVEDQSLRMSGEMIHCRVFRFPDAKLMVIADSDGDGRTGKAVMHSNELRARTNGATEFMEISNSFRLESQLENIIIGGMEEERELMLRVGELDTAYKVMMTSGPLTEGEPKEIVSLLRDIENALAEPKRNPHKLAASRNVGKGLNYRSPKAKKPVGPVTAITIKAAKSRVESRLREIVSIREKMKPKYELARAFNKEAEQLFKSLKDEKSMRSEAFPLLINKLDRMRLQPFEAPARKIEKLFDSFRYGDGIESEVLAAIRRELHAVLLVCVVERQVIRRLSRITHRRYEEADMKRIRLEAIDKLDRIGKRVEACSSFSESSRQIGMTKLGHARSILSQEELFETPKKRLKSADKILKDLTAILPV
jgi:hypothetical protein